LAELPGVHLISIQKPAEAAQVCQLAKVFPVVDFPGELDEANGAFMDTAAIMENVDLVISPDTSIVHLAGALGVPAWLALSTIVDWRWILKRADSPWYPTLRLFRQAELDNWAPVFEHMVKEVQKRLAVRLECL
jgi:hypothetical protein